VYGIGIDIMKIVIATLVCEECGKVWSIKKPLREIDEEEDLKHCGEYATIKKGFRADDEEYQE